MIGIITSQGILRRRRAALLPDIPARPAALPSQRIMLLCFSAMTVQADFKNSPVVDEAGFLSEEQQRVLILQLEWIREYYQMDVAIYTEETLPGNSAMERADDLYDNEGYGAGSGKDGILLYVSANPRKYHFTTHGGGMLTFTDNGLAYLEKQVLPKLKQDDYNGAFLTYADHAEELLAMAEQGTPYNQKQHSAVYVWIVLGAAFLLPLCIAGILMLRKLAQMKTAVKQDSTAYYQKPGSRVLEDSRDLFLYSSVIKTARPKNDGNSGDHTSSSGESHGGRGGDY